jgi:hypothetical protein
LGTLLLPLTPGVYQFNAAAVLNGTLTLDTQGNPNSAFVFQIGTTLTTGTLSQITLLNGNSVNIFWQIGTSATIGVNSTFYGNILADQSITINSLATINGRAIAINAAVTMDTNTITAPNVPEPGTWFAGALAFGFVAFTERRHIGRAGRSLAELLINNTKTLSGRKLYRSRAPAWAMNEVTGRLPNRRPTF